MQFSSSSALLAFLSCLHYCSAGAPIIRPKSVPTGEVVKLSEGTFETFVQENSLAMVKFFAPWCGHCKDMDGPYKEAAKLLKDQSISANVAEVDCTEQGDLCQKYEIGGYPSIMVFRNTSSKTNKYEGARDVDSIVGYLSRKSLPAVRKLESAEVLPLADKFKVVIVATLPANHRANQVFRKVATDMYEKDEKHVFASVVGNEAGITLYKKFDEGQAVYKGSIADLTEEDLLSWIDVESTPLMDDIGPDNYYEYMEKGKPIAYLFVKKEGEQRETYGKMVREVIRPHKGKIIAVFIDVDEFGAHAEALNLDLDKQSLGFVIDDLKENLKYPLTGKGRQELTRENLEAFVKGFIDGTLTPVFKSEPVPATNDGPLKTVVHDNFNQVVLDPTKDVLLEIYIPRCGACKSISGAYNEIAARYAPHSDKIVIAKMDGNLNDLPKEANFSIKYFPSLLLYPAGTNKLVEMNIDLKSESYINDIIDFISANATNKVEVAKEEVSKDAKKKESTEKELSEDEYTHDEL